MPDGILTDDILKGQGGGGKSGGGSARVAQEAPNTLRSKAVARVIDLVSEGPIIGLADGAKSIFLNETPLQAADGSYNFNGVTWHERLGDPVQSYIPGFAAAESERSVGVEVEQATPIVRTITDANVNRVRFTISIPALTEQNTTNGDLNGSQVQIAFDVKPNGGSWTEMVNDTIVGKTVSAYQKAYSVTLPGTGPWDIRMRRITADSGSSAVQNTTNWVGYTEVIDGKFIYPDSAVYGLELDSESFGSQMPSRGYLVKGLIVRVPDNYNPTTRVYTGVWGGEFKLAWTDNPVWCMLDMIVSTRYGLGIPLESIDIGAFYTVAQYCDGMVDDGFGGTEPRFTFNASLVDRDEVYKVIQAVASSFRGMVYWSSGAVTVTADMPTDPVQLVTAANVIDGSFSYSGTALKARHSVALVTWTDPNDGYRAAVEVVEDNALIEKYGYNTTDVTLIGCTSRGQAHRFGKWVLDTEDNETETVTYRASLDHAMLAPGEVISVADPDYAGVRFGGRVVTVGANSATLDAPVTLAAGETYSITFPRRDGVLETRVLTNTAGTYDVVTWTTPLLDTPEPNAVWVISGSDVAPRTFRVLAITEVEGNIFEIVALYNDPNKYARVEGNVKLDPISYTRLNKDFLTAPTNLTATENVYYVNGLPKSRISVSWTLAAAPEVSGYYAFVKYPTGDWQQVQVTRPNGFDLDDAAPGSYDFKVNSFCVDGRKSQPITLTNFASGGKVDPPAACASLVATGGFGAIDLKWTNPADTDLRYIEVWVHTIDDRNNAVLLARVDATRYAHTPLPSFATRFYWVRAVNIAGVYGAWNASGGTMATTQQLTHDDFADRILTESNLVPELQDKIISIQELAEAVLWNSHTLNENSVRLDNSEALISVEQNLRAAEDAALAQQIVTVQASVADVTALVVEEQLARVDADSAFASDLTQVQTDLNDSIATVQTLATSVDGLEASYTVKVDVNGYVAGYGLAVDANTATPTSEFVVLADSFSVILPSADNTIRSPFVVGTVDGVSRVSMSSAFIQDAAIVTAKIADANITTAKIADANITTAKINDAAITTAKIADAQITTAKIGTLQVTSATIADLTVGTTKITGNAVTNSVGASTTTDPGINNTWKTVVSVTITTDGGPVHIVAMLAWYCAMTNGSGFGQMRLLRGGTTVVAIYDVAYFNNDTTTAGTAGCQFNETPSAGTYTYYLQAYNEAAGNGTMVLKRASILALELKK